ncbi:hypothetical protein QT381_09395 [Galbitalea sp. SE-J8]|uniref:hypothetical protein n=1 Tax=Galbitalea sp. SE-J8 TaxID=3054952 RepID=UPI00259D029E|nr:hypothetical protein [Galbitalea sp. SE-J8]MDM4763223.1 hypothetical protein [Galbitalea sp. SE-J8]
MLPVYRRIVAALSINPTADQRLIGDVIQAAGLGRWLPKSASPATIRDAVQEILADDELNARAAATGRRRRAQFPGAEVAADRIAAVIDPRHGRPAPMA